MRIWVTGIGVVSPLARGAAATMDRLVAGDSAIGTISLFQLPDSRTRIAAEVSGLTAAEVAPPGEEEAWSRTDAMSVIAVREAIAQAGVDPHAGPVDLLVGGTTAGMYETEELLAWLSREPTAVSPLKRMLSHPLSSAADHVRAAVGPFRRVRSLCSACSSGANALLLGAAWIRAGLSKCVVAGGADGLCRLTFAGFGALSAMDPSPCRPFDRRRAGLNLGEGAGFLVLEPEDAARARGATPIVELRGWAVGAEAHHITNPEREGRTAARVMEGAMRRAGLTPKDIDYINAHGTATPLNDSMESAAIRACFGEEAERVAVSSSKGQIGHTLAAAGAIEAAITAMAVARGVMPPTVGLEEVDPACRLTHVTAARKAPIRAAMSNSFGFGGTDTCIVLSAIDQFPPPVVPERRSVVVVGAATVGPLGTRGVEGSREYLEPGPSPAPGAIAFQASDHLDVGRARRLDRGGRLTTVAIQMALREAGLDPLSDENAAVAGAIMGGAFGSVDGSTAYMCRIYDKGAKYASPADFPNLVPSSPVGHASIYLGMRGPVFAMADLAASAESAVVSAVELIHAGEGELIAAGSVEETSHVVEGCLSPICSGVERGVRSEGASVLLLESEPHAEARGARPLARVAWWTSWRGNGAGALAGLTPPSMKGAALITGDASDVRAVLAGSPWAEVPRRVASPRAGEHEGAGGVAMAAAVGAIAGGELEAALVVGSAPDRGYAVLLVSAAPVGPA
ncbi:beta-ketoacyl-[acyl-carrier-protein] synthase family protein [Polyangium aurulentum]|uniref:beta-ketoacyl-[acyl-carrier-protein] synthase family protein n=1 Tax=Polyangium aurulentum TaxID=2567896 RepID=UPI0010AEDD08|nr:beta-ketoacyl-[acyl-carrier-protein] synthase family protein [Polyangium aurulentum]UQA55352.1 beta-ketoacyl-[acyl-carrier-protein] synthase family protein [Polyangium aurulentum]